MKYADKNGVTVKDQDLLQHDDGSVYRVHPCYNGGSGEDDLGIPANNEEFRKNHPDTPDMFYPLHQFDMKEWQVISEG